ncbi:hypothetical protein [Tsukamurella soli]|uniref:hypothetical protein n=1 Tax=Tsukamurella soli TaxID=644556 RepID=UPI0036210250
MPRGTLPAQRSHVATAGGALNFFVDDYRFESVQSLPRAAGMPRAAQMWNAYRSAPTGSTTA